MVPHHNAAEPREPVMPSPPKQLASDLRPVITPVPPRLFGPALPTGPFDTQFPSRGAAIGGSRSGHAKRKHKGFTARILRAPICSLCRHMALDISQTGDTTCNHTVRAFTETGLNSHGKSHHRHRPSRDTRGVFHELASVSRVSVRVLPFSRTDLGIPESGATAAARARGENGVISTRKSDHDSRTH